MSAASIALLILWLAAAYLVGLGLVAIARPSLALNFLSSFGQTNRANILEAACRSAIGAAMMGAGSSFHMTWAWLLAGLFLVLSALWMVWFPKAHRRIAQNSVASVAPFIRWIGLASIAMGAALGLYLLDR